ncbi:MAG: carboxymuconolactone decarboxylase family protein [Gammaproteobacteria bacterium]
MNIEQLNDKLSDCAKDIKLNFSVILTEEGAPDLNHKQRYGIALASAYAIKNAMLITAIMNEAIIHLTDNEIKAARSAANIMAMNNVYYRFIHLVSDKSYGNMPAKLRMNVIANPGISKDDFELNCLAVSAINGCGLCIDAHTQALMKEGISKLGIQSAIRIAAVLNGVAASIE